MSRKCKNCTEDILGSKRKDSMYCSISCGNLFRGRRYYHLHPEKMKSKRQNENSYVEKRIYLRVKSRAKRNSILYTLTEEDILVPKKCPVLGIPIYSTLGGGTNQYNSPSLDRIDPMLGYTKENTRVISNRANLLKSNATVEELSLVLKDLIRIKQCD